MVDKFGNDLDYWYYCPVCGKSLLPSFVYCTTHKKVLLVKSLYTKDYYKRIALEEQNYISTGFDVLQEKEIITNPLYDSSENQKSQPQLQPFYKPHNTNNNKPKCPTCQSTNIKKISVVKKVTHGLMFGVLSKTAFSQFECCNCGYKW